MRTLLEIAANLEAEHDWEHGDICDCFHRLLAAVRGKPDPTGEAYRWPRVEYTVQEAPQFGPVPPPWKY